MSRAFDNRAQVDDKRLTWSQHLCNARDRFDRHLPQLEEGQVVFLVDGPVQALESLVYGRHHDLDFGIVPASRMTEALEERLSEQGIALIDAGTELLKRPAGEQHRVPGRVSVMTSGTTGLMKSIPHTWQTLDTMRKVSSGKSRFWYVPYQPGSYAWYQMMCLGLFHAGEHLSCPATPDPVEGFARALKAGITAVSSTPTFWRCVLMSIDREELEQSRLEAISLGGEIVDQAILDQLREIFPRASLRHIYASSEAGAAIVVNDGFAGFPSSRLTDGDVAVKVEEGRLYVRSPYTTAAAAGRDGDWIDTGDLVEVKGERVFFLGRQDASMINVGGAKAFTAEIERELMQHPNVAWTRVYPRRAPLVGSVPAAQVVLRRASPRPIDDEGELAAFARKRLPEHAVPRTWQFLASIPIGANLKS